MRYHSHCVGIPDHATRATTTTTTTTHPSLLPSPVTFPGFQKRLALADGYLPYLAKPHRLASPPTSTLPCPSSPQNSQKHRGTETREGGETTWLDLSWPGLPGFDLTWRVLWIVGRSVFSHVTQPAHRRCRLQQPQRCCLASDRLIGRVIGRNLLPCPISCLACATYRETPGWIITGD